MARALSFTAGQLFLRQQAMHVVCWRQIRRCISQGSSRGGSPGKGGPKRKVAVLGAAGGIGQPLGLLMKLSPLVTDLALFDIAGTPGVACDLSHVNTQAKVMISRNSSQQFCAKYRSVERFHHHVRFFH